MNLLTMLLPRLAIGAGGIALGAVVVLMAWENGNVFAPGPHSAFWGAAFAAAVIICWFLPVIANSTTRGIAFILRAAWLAGTLFVLANAIGYTAMHRDENVGSASTRIAAYDLALRDLPRLEAELEAMKPNARWRATAGCSNATVPKSDSYCHEVRAVQDKIAETASIIRTGKPRSADPQADRLSMVLRISAEDVGTFLPIFTAVVLELLATVAITAAFAPIRSAKPAEPAPLALADPAWLSSEPFDGKRLPQAKVFDFNIDGRKLRHYPKRAANS